MKDDPTSQNDESLDQPTSDDSGSNADELHPSVDANSETSAPGEASVETPAPNPMASKSRAIRPYGIETGRQLAAAAARVAIDNKGQDVIILDVSKQSAEFDFFVLSTGTSRRQLHAISEQIDDVLQKELGDRRLGIEGYEESRWIVLDYGSVVIHLFDDETREYYDLESLWADGEVIPLEVFGLKPNPKLSAE